MEIYFGDEAGCRGSKRNKGCHSTTQMQPLRARHRLNPPRDNRVHAEFLGGARDEGRRDLARSGLMNRDASTSQKVELGSRSHGDLL